MSSLGVDIQLYFTGTGARVDLNQPVEPGVAVEVEARAFLPEGNQPAQPGVPTWIWLEATSTLIKMADDLPAIGPQPGEVGEMTGNNVAVGTQIVVPSAVDAANGTMLIEATIGGETNSSPGFLASSTETVPIGTQPPQNITLAQQIEVLAGLQVPPA